MTDLSIYAGGEFQILTSNLLGLNISATNTSAPDNIKANKLWSDFLISLGFVKANGSADEMAFEDKLKTNGTIDPAKVKTYTGLYNAFLTDQLQTIAASAKSILTIQQTKVLWSIFDIMILLMQKTNESQIIEAQTIKFFTDYQKEYQANINRAFMYMGGVEQTGATPSRTDPTVSHANTNIDTYNLGYGNITMGEMVQYLLTTAKNKPGTEAFYISPPGTYLSGSGNTSVFLWRITYNADDTYTIAMGCNNAVNGVTTNVWIITPAPGIVPASNAKQECQRQFDLALSAGKSWNSNYGLAIPYPKVGEKDVSKQTATNTASITFTYSGTNQDLKILYAAAVAERGSRNRSIQTGIDVLNTKKETLGDRAQQIQRLIDSSLSARNQTATFLLSLITQLKTILSSITK